MWERLTQAALMWPSRLLSLAVWLRAGVRGDGEHPGIFVTGEEDSANSLPASRATPSERQCSWDHVRAPIHPLLTSPQSQTDQSHDVLASASFVLIIPEFTKLERAGRRHRVFNLQSFPVLVKTFTCIMVLMFHFSKLSAGENVIIKVREWNTDTTMLC